MECGDGTLCCDESFEFDFTGINLDTVEFYPIENTRTIVMIFIKDGGLYLTISFDCGQTFEEPRKIADVNSEAIKDIQLLANEDQFVVAVKERIGDQDYKRAFSGMINANLRNFTFRECPRSRAAQKGGALKIALGFRKYKPTSDESATEECESVDYKFFIEGNTVNIECCGHH
jgi:hypothetical protein